MPGCPWLQQITLPLPQTLRFAIASGTSNTLSYGAGFISIAKVKEPATVAVVSDL
ncbi:hypothetical protein [Candidatus Magnetobacterium casense]|uniref:Uncharacterized protein n=1 Tax=Candidatus Magnetobacterium casense TaxID=1455061 RepID=A0ABS6RW77_9BACT|nr:hypothetical protein [Candidatus Magnetobacterium casensis]MBV6340600.1 hypothetical protein [Candidatus Magnetobacterium casensis]